VSVAAENGMLLKNRGSSSGSARRDSTRSSPANAAAAARNDPTITGLPHPRTGPSMAWTARKAISQPVLGARLHSSEPRPKKVSPAWKVRLRPTRSPIDPPSMRRLARTSV